MTITMPSDEKSHNITTPVIYQQPQVAKERMTKKYVLIGLGLLVGLGLIVTAILVGIHLYNNAQMNLLVTKYTLQMEGNRRQEVVGDQNSNIVKIHVTDDQHEAYIVNDFNTEIKVTKIIGLDGENTNCYIAALNLSNALTPDKISKPSNAANFKPTRSIPILYKSSGHPVEDISFLNKDAREMCKGVSTYWVYPSCGDDLPTDLPTFNQSMLRRKRDAPYWVYSRKTIDGFVVPCINGCCKTVCACRIHYSWSITNNNQISCSWIYQSCCPEIIGKCPFSQTCEPTPGLTCPEGKC